MFEALDNFRDFGGYDTADGRRLKTGLLYRSAHHGAMTDADLAALATHGIGTIVDLRRPDERKRTPSRRWPDFAGQVIESDIGEDSDDPWMTFIRSTDDLSPAAMRGYMIEYYASAPLEDRHLDLFSRYFDALERNPGGMLVHCAAGKDRTGMLVALTQHLAGVPDETILHDYLLTNTRLDFVARAPEIARSIEAVTGRAISDAAMLAGLMIEADHLRTALGSMIGAYGSIDAYIEQALGVTAPRKAAILDRLLD